MSNFEYQDSKRINHSIEVTPDDLTLVQEHEVITDQKMQSKPTTFFKDAMKRFSKNKSSVVGGIILGTLVLLSIILPFAISSDVSDGVYANNYQKSLYPKLFAAGTGWWDGCKQVNDVVVSIDYDKYEESEGKEIVALGSSSYKSEAIVGGTDGITVTGVSYENGTSSLGYGGYVRLFGTDNPTMASPYLPDSFDYTVDQGLAITIETSSSSIAGDTSWEFGHEDAPYGIYFMYTATVDYRSTTLFAPLVTGITERGTITVNFDEYRQSVVEAIGDNTIRNPAIAIRVDTSSITDGVDANLLVEETSMSATDSTLNEVVSTYGFDDANAMLQTGSSAVNYWSSYRSYTTAYRVKIFKGSFRYDTYIDALGDYDDADISYSDLRAWISRGWLRICTRDDAGEILVEDGLSLVSTSALSGLTREEVQAIADSLSFEILNERCPLVSEDSVTKTAQYVDQFSVVFGGRVTRWKALFLDASSCPSYLFGTDAEGKDLLKYVAEGLRTSLILGFLTFLVCFTFGLIYGAIAGYYGGWTDILMERVTDILGGVPWIVVMTLAIIKWGSNFMVFTLALCFTGWISTSSTTRTQFYRYKNREYILAARTLGASDSRLIFRHILPNAVGTIVTSSVLMIPSVIYSEATLAYLNLGLQGLSSFGVILSDNQAYIQTDSYMIIFPAVVMALLMISFNLFGNGLRDAFNPSLKGAEQ